MGSTDWTEDQLVHDLSEGFRLLGRLEADGGMERGEAAILAQGVLACMNGALVKVSEVLEEQARLRRELSTLRQEHALALRDSRAAESRKDARIAALESELKNVRALLSEDRGPRLHHPAPPDALLRQPLVVRGPGGDFLGVCDSGGAALCIADLLLLTQRSDPSRVVSSSWSASDEGWVLELGLAWNSAKCAAYSLLLAPVRTPSGNTVTHLAGMNVDRCAVPQEFLLRMFRKIRERAVGE